MPKYKSKHEAKVNTSEPLFKKNKGLGDEAPIEAESPEWAEAPVAINSPEVVMPHVESEDLEEKEKASKKKKEHKSSKKTAVIILAVLAILALGVFIGGKLVSQSDTILNKVFVGNIDVSKLTKEEALEKLNESGWKQRAADPLVLTTIGNQQIEIDPVKSGMVLSPEDAAEMAYAYGHGENELENFFTFLFNLVKSVDVNDLNKKVSDGYLDGCVDDVTDKVNEYMGQELYTLDLEQSVMHLKKGWGEIELDRVELKNSIISSLEEGKTALSYTSLVKEPTCPDFQAILIENEKEPRDASYTDDNKFDVIDEVVGVTFNPAKATEMWNEAAPGEEITIPVEVTWPSVTGEDLRGRLFHDLLGAMTSEFPNSAADRISNLQLCSSKIDGTILYPGDIFSYNDIVGPRTEEAGFKNAPAYSDGEVTLELGGGACQVASTIYAASLFAFLETVERTCHQFPVNYMQMGTDATVAWTADGTKVDLKFKNSKQYPIKIVVTCDAENRTLTAEIWGTLEDDDYMPIEFDNRYSYTNTYDRFIEPAYADREGYSIKLSIIGDIYTLSDEEGNPLGLQTLTHRLVYDSSGTLVEDQIVNLFVENINGYGLDTYYKHP